MPRVNSIHSTSSVRSDPLSVPRHRGQPASRHAPISSTMMGRSSRPLKPAPSYLDHQQARPSSMIMSSAIFPPNVASHGLTARNLLYYLYCSLGILLEEDRSVTVADRAAYLRWSKSIPQVVQQHDGVGISPIPSRLAGSDSRHEARVYSAPLFLWQAIMDWVLLGRPSFAPPRWPHCSEGPLRSGGPSLDALGQFLYFLGVNSVDLATYSSKGLHPLFWEQMRAHVNRRGGEIIPVSEYTMAVDMSRSPEFELSFLPPSDLADPSRAKVSASHATRRQVQAGRLESNALIRPQPADDVHGPPTRLVQTRAAAARLTSRGYSSSDYWQSRADHSDSETPAPDIDIAENVDPSDCSNNNGNQVSSVNEAQSPPSLPDAVPPFPSVYSAPSTAPAPASTGRRSKRKDAEWLPRPGFELLHPDWACGPCLVLAAGSSVAPRCYADPRFPGRTCDRPGTQCSHCTLTRTLSTDLVDMVRALTIYRAFATSPAGPSPHDQAAFWSAVLRIALFCSRPRDKMHPTIRGLLLGNAELPGSQVRSGSPRSYPAYEDEWGKPGHWANLAAITGPGVPVPVARTIGDIENAFSPQDTILGGPGTRVAIPSGVYVVPMDAVWLGGALACGMCNSSQQLCVGNEELLNPLLTRRVKCLSCSGHRMCEYFSSGDRDGARGRLLGRILCAFGKWVISDPTRVSAPAAAPWFDLLQALVVGQYDQLGALPKVPPGATRLANEVALWETAPWSLPSRKIPLIKFPGTASVADLLQAPSVNMQWAAHISSSWDAN